MHSSTHLGVVYGALFEISAGLVKCQTIEFCGGAPYKIARGASNELLDETSLFSIFAETYEDYHRVPWRTEIIIFNLRGQIGTPETFQAIQIKEMDLITQNDLSLCLTCNDERCPAMKTIYDSMTNDKLWTQSTAMSALLDCSLTSFPSSGKCVPCVEDRKVNIVCPGMPKDLKLDLEDGKGHSFSNTEATCPRLKAAGPVGQAGHNSGDGGLAGRPDTHASTLIPDGTGGIYKGATTAIVMSAAAFIFLNIFY
ncbi:uncharacterized protein LOC121581521 isoform X2 [Coregonus clupeaformis]|uniref:uncharacterized protein LOC121581521 isoform X2 n=1 Tax=Coregonus clupeaformis TaxID=59861 RepID=UPI001BE088E0|nr:uncharacterized protein LOC121581521 isoform X2 [Coregonus clupeaformis]